MSGYYELKRSGDQFMFNLKAANHEVILTSERYTSKASAQDGIASVRQNSPVDARYERKTATNGSPYFTLTATNGQTIGRSEMYSSTSARDNGIASVKTNGPTQTVKDNTLNANGGGGIAATASASLPAHGERVRHEPLSTNFTAGLSQGIPRPAPPGSSSRRRQSTCAPDCLTALPHLSTSPAMNAPVASGFIGIGSAPRSRKNFCISGVPSTWPICWLR